MLFFSTRVYLKIKMKQQKKIKIKTKYINIEMRKREKEKTSPEGTSPGAAAVPMFVGMWSLLKRSI